MNSKVLTSILTILIATTACKKNKSADENKSGGGNSGTSSTVSIDSLSDSALVSNIQPGTRLKLNRAIKVPDCGWYSASNGPGSWQMYPTPLVFHEGVAYHRIGSPSSNNYSFISLEPAKAPSAGGSLQDQPFAMVHSVLATDCEDSKGYTVNADDEYEITKVSIDNIGLDMSLNLGYSIKDPTKMETAWIYFNSANQSFTIKDLKDRMGSEVTILSPKTVD